MMSKKIFAIVFFALLSVPQADVVFPIYAADEFVMAYSLEKVCAFEHKIVKNFSVLPWGGVAFFWPYYQKIFGGPVAPAGGIEAALECRFYTPGTELSALFIGIYGGGAFMFPSYAAVGTSIGIKAGYKHVFVKRSLYNFALEPYGSLSTLPVVHSTFYQSDEILHFPGAIITFGIRFVSQWATR